MPGVKPQRIRHKVPTKSNSARVQKARRRSSLPKLYAQNARSRTSSYDSRVPTTVQQCLPVLEVSLATLTGTRGSIATKASTTRTPSDLLPINPGAKALPTLPIYEVKQSARALQQRGLSWLSTSAKEKHDRERGHKLAQWGVAPGHKGTCVLCPDYWRHSDPLDLMALCSRDNYPSQTATRARYSYMDYGTSFVRATAWFDVKWPRSGVELDNFMGYGPYKPMDASHLCHQNHCLTHVTYEPAHINQDRKRCHRLAQLLRRQKKEIPEHCTEHEPFCEMQVRYFGFLSRTLC